MRDLVERRFRWPAWSSPAGRRALAAVAAVLLASSLAAGSVSAQPVLVAAPPTQGDAEAGASVYQAECAMCHGPDGSGMMGMHPALRGAVERLSAEGVEVTVRNGRATTPPMPAFGNQLSDEEIADVVAYIGSLPDGPRNFGPGYADGMGRGMTGRMGGAPMWLLGLLVVLFVAVAGLVAYLIAQRRSG